MLNKYICKRHLPDCFLLEGFRPLLQKHLELAAVETRLVHELINLIWRGILLFIPNIAVKIENPATTLWEGD